MCVLTLMLSACGGSGGTSARLRVWSPAFASGAPIPIQYTCDGADVQPPVRWSGVPSRARELMLVMRDPDAPGGDFVHWALAAIPAATRAVPPVPPGAVAGRNGFGTTGYRGPCPPSGAPAHHYVVTVFALAGDSGLRPGFDATGLHLTTLAQGTVTGTYRRR